MMEDFSKYNGEGTDLRRAQLRMLDIVKVIDDVCRRHNIVYWADFGTLLGAVRHGGFIPWDDDLDISLFEDEYRRLLPLLEKELPEGYALQTYSNEKNFPYSFAKVVDLHSVVEQNAPWASRLKDKGLWVDIFPMVRGTSSIRRIVEPIYGRCYRHARGFSGNGWSKFIAYMLYPVALLAKGASWLAVRFVNKDKYVAAYGTGRLAVHNCTRLVSKTLPVRMLSFEGVQLPFPNDTDANLRALYGEYMQVPPPEKRGTHIGKIIFDV